MGSGAVRHFGLRPSGFYIWMLVGHCRRDSCRLIRSIRRSVRSARGPKYQQQIGKGNGAMASFVYKRPQAEILVCHFDTSQGGQHPFVRRQLTVFIIAKAL